MSEQEYAWMLGLMVAWRQRYTDNRDGSRMVLQAVYARAGRFHGIPQAPANDLLAALFICCLIADCICAKSAANSAVFTLLLRKITRPDFLRPPAVNPH